MSNGQKAQMLDALMVSDTFVSGLADVEHLGGGVLRFSFYSRQHVGGIDHMVCVAKLVMPTEAVLPAVRLTAEMIGIEGVRFVEKLTN